MSRQPSDAEGKPAPLPGLPLPQPRQSRAEALEQLASAAYQDGAITEVIRPAAILPEAAALASCPRARLTTPPKPLRIR